MLVSRKCDLVEFTAALAGKDKKAVYSAAGQEFREARLKAKRMVIPRDMDRRDQAAARAEQSKLMVYAGNLEALCIALQFVSSPPGLTPQGAHAFQPIFDELIKNRELTEADRERFIAAARPA